MKAIAFIHEVNCFVYSRM